MVNYALAKTKDLLTSRAGLILTHKVISKTRLNELADRYFPKPGSNRGFAPHTYILSLVMMFHEGGSALSHIQRIQQDMALRTLFDLRFVPGEDALRKWLHQHKAYGVQALTEINRHLLKMALKDQHEVTLDIDATFIKSHKQEAQWAYLKSKGYMPIVAHIAETGQVAAADFREGNVAPATRNFEFLQACEAALPHGVKVSRFRSDAAAYQHRILDHCIDEGMNFTVRASMSTAVRKRIPAEDDPRWQPMIGRDGQIVEGEMTCRIIHAMEGSKQPFTLVIKRQAIEGQLSFDLDDDDTTTVQQGQFTYRAIATNLDDWQDHEIIHWYNQRGEHAENRIKELKSDFAGHHIPFKDFEANAFFFHCNILAYNLFALMRQALPKTLRCRRVRTIRHQIYALAGKLVHHARQWRLMVAREHYELLQSLLLSIQQQIPDG